MTQKQHFKIFTFAFLIFGFLSFISPIYATEPGVGRKINIGLRNLFDQSGYFIHETAGIPLALRVGVIVNTLFLLVGIIFLIFTVYSGIQWMLAGGNDETLKKARTRIIRATVGLLIVVGAWIITSFVLNAAFTPVDNAPDPSGLIEIRRIRRF